MKVGKFFIILAVIGAGLFFFFGRKTNYTNLPPTATGDWVAFGDSLTTGVGADEGNDYPTLLGQQLDKKILNFGVPGNTTQDGLGRVAQALELKPRVVLLCLGGNDGLRGLSLEQAFENLSSIIDSFHEAGSFVVLIGVHSASLRDTNSKRFQQLAKEKKVFYVPDILDGVLGRPSLMSDYIHPNDAGYRVIAERLASELEPVLGKL